jgi:hypothetical protein
VKIKKTAPGKTMPQGAFGPRSPGRFITYYSRDQYIAQKWPKKRTKFTPEQLEQQAEFKQLVRALKNIPADMRVATEEIAEGSKYIWRDVAARFMVGRMVDFPNYGEIVAQYNLDILGDEPGMMVARNVNEWFALARGNDGEVLVLVNGLPAWGTNSGNPSNGPPYAPKMQSGRRYLPPSPSALINASFGTGTLKTWPFYIPHPMTIDGFKMQVSAGSPVGTLAVGIYQDTDGLPDALLIDAGTMSSATSGEKTITGLAFAVQPGFIWIAAKSSASLTLSHMPATALSCAMMLGQSNLASGNSPHNHVSIAHIYGTGAMPDPFPGTPTLITAAFPAIALIPS